MTNDQHELRDSPEDEKKLREDETTIDLPEVKDIPGQENIKPPRIREMRDSTPSSDAEEGKGVLDNINKEDRDEDIIVTGTDTDISPEEVAMLERMDGFEASGDNQNLADASLDSTDFDGDELNERSFGEEITGEDLDVEPAGQDDPMEKIGEEDEENNIYSPDTEDEDGATIQ